MLYLMFSVKVVPFASIVFSPGKTMRSMWFCFAHCVTFVLMYVLQAPVSIKAVNIRLQMYTSINGLVSELVQFTNGFRLLFTIVFTAVFCDVDGIGGGTCGVRGVCVGDRAGGTSDEVTGA